MGVFAIYSISHANQAVNIEPVPTSTHNNIYLPPQHVIFSIYASISLLYSTRYLWPVKCCEGCPARRGLPHAKAHLRSQDHFQSTQQNNLAHLDIHLRQRNKRNKHQYIRLWYGRFSKGVIRSDSVQDVGIYIYITETFPAWRERERERARVSREHETLDGVLDGRATMQPNPS